MFCSFSLTCIRTLSKNNKTHMSLLDVLSQHACYTYWITDMNSQSLCMKLLLETTSKLQPSGPYGVLGHPVWHVSSTNRAQKTKHGTEQQNKTLHNACMLPLTWHHTNATTHFKACCHIKHQRHETQTQHSSIGFGAKYYRRPKILQIQFSYDQQELHTPATGEND